VVTELSRSRPMLVVMADKIAVRRDWAMERAVPADY